MNLHASMTNIVVGLLAIVHVCILFCHSRLQHAEQEPAVERHRLVYHNCDRHVGLLWLRHAWLDCGYGWL